MCLEKNLTMSESNVPKSVSKASRSCLVLIGMAACGKSAVGRKTAEILKYAHLDTDHLIEATYGSRLQNIVDKLDKESFLDIEAQVICSINARRAVISTGGSAVYRPQAMKRLAQMGVIVYIDVSLPLIMERIARKPNRGIAIAPGQTIEELFLERKALYGKWADVTVKTDGFSIMESARAVINAAQPIMPQMD
jgi:shikimate kinase